MTDHSHDWPLVRLGFIGFGIVGTGAYRVLDENLPAIQQKIGARLEVKRICVRSPEKPRPVQVDSALLTTDAHEVTDDPEIDVVCELMGGVEPARSYILRALEKGKHVVTANKELIARQGHGLLSLAAQKRLDFQFEGSVAGGIPIINTLKVALAANRIESLFGIVNGTTNYILTRMGAAGLTFADALAEAQAQGFAEADPTSDVYGYDAAYKIAILASIAFQSTVNIEEVFCEGLQRVDEPDIRYARELGFCIKLLAIARARGDRMDVRVHPALVPLDHPLASVANEFNAVFIKGSAVGELMLFGRGAGSLPTGSAVAGDIMETVRNVVRGSTGRVACTCFTRKEVVPIAEVETGYYARIRVEDRPGVLAEVARLFGANGVSLESVLQKASHADVAEIVWTTHRAPEARFRAAIEAISQSPVVHEVCNWIRVEEEMG
jgi:homoserine dehydrogenase